MSVRIVEGRFCTIHAEDKTLFIYKAKTVLFEVLPALSAGLYVKNRGKEFQGSHSDEVFFSLSAEDADTQAVVFKIPEAVRSSLDELHFPVEAFGNPVIFREAEHPGNLFLP